MTHFKKWWDNYSWTTDVGKQGLGPNKCEAVAKGAYKEALEWVKKEAISLDERGDISRGIINRELES